MSLQVCHVMSADLPSLMDYLTDIFMQVAQTSKNLKLHLMPHPQISFVFYYSSQTFQCTLITRVTPSFEVFLLLPS